MFSHHSHASFVIAVGLFVVLAGPLGAQTAVSDSAEFVAWRTAQEEDVDQLRQKLMALAGAIPPDKLTWRPMEGTRSFREVFAHVAAEGNVVPVGFGKPLLPGSVADFDAEEARLGALSDDNLVTAMDDAMQNLSAAIAALSPSSLNVPITYFGRSTLPRVAVSRILGDLHEHLGQLISYARMNAIVPPWSREPADLGGLESMPR
jgi:hypothetical protein